ncbi:hypothetical protein LTR09_000803 [Extremus antarcticus]|uniref:Uncharacterized protein n=1 Tax=Extremus antarcticus TaxID=702011 RepID=A0AAJ0GKB4_9PEZI|nr:hypothetical protein LTR09_000803 [Extremus antarcticus]
MGAISEPNHHLCIPLNGLWCPGSLGLDSGISVYFDGVFCQSTDVWVRKSSYPVNIRISVGREGDSSSLRLRLHEVEGAGRNMVLFQQPVVKEAQVHFGCKHTFADGKAAGYCTAPDNAFSDTGGTIGDVSDIASRMQQPRYVLALGGTAELAGTTLEAWDDWLAKRISSGGDSEEESAEGEDSEDESTASEHAEGGDTEGETLAECVEGEK